MDPTSLILLIVILLGIPTILGIIYPTMKILYDSYLFEDGIPEGYSKGIIVRKHIDSETCTITVRESLLKEETEHMLLVTSDQYDTYNIGDRILYRYRRGDDDIDDTIDIIRQEENQ